MKIENTPQPISEVTSFTINFGKEKPYEAVIELSDGTNQRVKITNEKLENESNESIRKLATDLLSKKLNPQPADHISNPGAAEALRTEDQQMFWKLICSEVNLGQYKDKFILEVDRSSCTKPKYRTSDFSDSAAIALTLTSKNDQKSFIQIYRKIDLWKKVENNRDIESIKEELADEISFRLSQIRCNAFTAPIL
ncbi:MAG: hypothetical protein AAGG81_04505 [Chlamydiota bacterium]